MYPLICFPSLNRFLGQYTNKVYIIIMTACILSKSIYPRSYELFAYP